MRRTMCMIATLLCAVGLWAAERVPGEQWMQYADPAQAGFDAARLDAAHAIWEALPSSAFLVVSDGVVVAAWGDVSRRFMCHSVRKSFMSALYGIYWDREEIELNKTIAELGIHEELEPLMAIELQARILDLLKARSGVFHPAAYAGRTDSQPRGSQGPGRYFAYNNWDFNTLAAIFRQETGADVFEAFDEFFAQPLEMEDWRVSDGYYHFERDKSVYPAYPFRMSARDAARFGMVFARKGMWGDEQILSRDWVARSLAMYSIDDENMGYGLLWWVFREPRFKQYGMAAALGVGNQMIAVLPDIDLVIVNRANTYQGEGTPMPALLDLIEAVLEARIGSPQPDPKLVPLKVQPPDPRLRPVLDEQLTEFVGDWPYPPAPLGLPQLTTVSMTIDDGALVAYSGISGTFRTYLQPDGSIVEEDSLERYLPIRNDDGQFAGFADVESIGGAAVAAAAADDMARANALLGQVENDTGVGVGISRAVVDQLAGNGQQAEKALAELLAGGANPRRVEAVVNAAGYTLLEEERTDAAIGVFELNTRLFPEAFNAWDSLGEAYMTAGKTARAIASYEKSLELNPKNTNATEMITRMREGGGE
jgi:CubicO group peptidase (beta-lactamase class C family)/predicted negative regulator of RcsB-dependent stress response